MVAVSDLLLLDPDELESRLTESRRELFNLRFQLATGQLDNSARMGQVRRDIARILTVLRDREIQEAEGMYEPVPRPAGRATRANLTVDEEIDESAYELAPGAHDDEQEEEA